MKSEQTEGYKIISDAEIQRKITKRDFSAFSDAKDCRDWLKRTKIAETSKSAEAWMRKNIPAESYYQRKILEFLNDARMSGHIPRNSVIWKDQAGMYQQRGIPDVCAVIRGKFFGFEVKRPLLGIPSDLQRKMIHDLNDAGGVAKIVSYPWEVEEILRKHGRWKECQKTVR